MHLKLSNVSAFPTVAISIILALTLILFGIYAVIPADWLGVAVPSVYPNIIVRSIFGVLTASSGAFIMYFNIRYDLRTLLTVKFEKYNKHTFFMSVTFFYLATLRMLYIGFFPPIWLLYLALGFISATVWFSNKRNKEI